MDLSFFSDTHYDQFVLIPTFVVEEGCCECCGGGAPFMGFVWLLWSIGLLIQKEDHSQ